MDSFTIFIAAQINGQVYELVAKYAREDVHKYLMQLRIGSGRDKRLCNSDHCPSA